MGNWRFWTGLVAALMVVGGAIRVATGGHWWTLLIGVALAAKWIVDERERRRRL